MHRGAVAEIDLDAVADNLGLIRNIAQRPVIAVVKADAYGHGAVEVSKRLVTEGVSCLAVAFSEEGVRLRNAGIDAPILVFFDKWSTSDFFDYHLIPVIHDVPSAVRLSEDAKKRGRRLAVHIEIDTGMGRLGLHRDELLEDIITIAGLDGLVVEGLMSHFSDADMAERSYAEKQLRKFAGLREKALPILGKEIVCHIANSAAVLSFKEAYLDAVRPGLALYGYSPFSDSAQLRAPGKVGSGFDLRPAMTVRTRILSVRKLHKGTPVSYGRTFVTARESLVAVLPVGYADGYGRILSNNAEVLVGGRRAPVIGRVCMDLMMADVTNFEGVAEGDEVVLIGKQGGEEITVHEIARRAGTISYEVLTTLGGRSKRVYK
ncbi:MAG TPA: alanine racemase [Thermodesulfovibrionales bacterium]|nr:alanine racemase [Thermodesulfovibrionales bacterium]